MATQVDGVITKISTGDDKEYSIASSAYGYCQTAAATAAKVVDMTGFKLVTGATIFVKFQYANSVANPTLNVNGTGAKPIYRYGTTRPSTNASTNGWPAGAVMAFTYDGSGWQEHYWYNNQYTLSNQYQSNGNFTADSAIYRYQLLFHMDEDTLSPLNNADNNTGTSKTMLTTMEFDPFLPIYYYESTTTVAANGNVAASFCHFQQGGCDLRYSFNCGDSSLTSMKNVYLKCSKQSNVKFRIASAAPLTQTLPSASDGYYYILLGRAYSGYQIGLYADKPIFYHDGTALRIYTDPAKAVPFAALTGSPTDNSALNTALANKADTDHDHDDVYLGIHGTADVAKSALAIQLKTEDLNDIIPDNTTWYFAAGGNTVVNKPANANAFGMVCFRDASGYRTQILQVAGTNSIYIRHKGGSTYGAWTQIMITDTTYTGENGVTVSGTKISNAGVRSIATGSANGTISVNTNGNAADVPVKGLGTAAYTESTAYAAKSHTHDDRYYTESEINTKLSAKQDTLTFDTAPTASSTNPVTSGGVKTALDNKYFLSSDNSKRIKTIANDTVPNWAALENCVFFYSTDDELIDKPSDYGILINNSIGNEVSQIWFTQPSGKIYRRSGSVSGSGWATSWVELVNGVLYYENRVVNVATSAQIMRIPVSGTSTLITTNTVVLECTFAAPENIISNVTWTSYAGYITFTGTCKAATTANVVLGTKSN